MPADKNPVFRKAIIPWYRSTGAFFIVIFFMLLVFLFSIAGVTVATEDPAYRGYVWVPVALLAMSAGIIITTAARLVKRYSRKAGK